jgi:hypothetical protein
MWISYPAVNNAIIGLFLRCPRTVASLGIAMRLTRGIPAHSRAHIYFFSSVNRAAEDRQHDLMALVRWHYGSQLGGGQAVDPSLAISLRPNGPNHSMTTCRIERRRARLDARAAEQRSGVIRLKRENIAKLLFRTARHCGSNAADLL